MKLHFCCSLVHLLQEKEALRGPISPITDGDRICFNISIFFQHYLTMLGGTLAIPFILSGPMCFANNILAISEVLSTIFFVSGFVTLLQSTFGVRFVKSNICKMYYSSDAIYVTFLIHYYIYYQ